MARGNCDVDMQLCSTQLWGAAARLPRFGATEPGEKREQGCALQRHAEAGQSDMLESVSNE
jgi:hypothetical protein